MGGFRGASGCLLIWEKGSLKPRRLSFSGLLLNHILGLAVRKRLVDRMPGNQVTHSRS